MRDSPTLSTPMARFADSLLAHDLPMLPDDRRRETVGFIGRRIAMLPSITRFGVIVIGTAVGFVGRVAGDDRAISMVTSLPIPLVAEYPRLIRSLGFAFVWETWPNTQTDGRPA